MSAGKRSCPDLICYLLSVNRVAHLHSAALKGGAEREQLSYSTMAQLKAFESKGQAAFGARHAHPAPTRARLHGCRAHATKR